jgi:arylformamidase
LSFRFSTAAAVFGAACFFMAGAAAAADAPATKAAAAASSAVAKVERDVAYGKHPRQRFDVYLPAKAAGPVLLVVHGGGWSAGDKAAPSVADRKARYWASQGYVLVSTNYRLLPQATPLEQAQDVARALAQAQRLAPQWGADPKKFVLMGIGSGGYPVALLNAGPALALREGAQRWKGAVGVDSEGLDLVAQMQGPHDRALDRAFGKDPAHWKAASPMTVMTPDSPPVLFLCSSLRPEPCQHASSYELRASELKLRVVIWTQKLTPAQSNAQLGMPGYFTDSVAGWIRSIL